MTEPAGKCHRFIYHYDSLDGASAARLLIDHFTQNRDTSKFKSWQTDLMPFGDEFSEMPETHVLLWPNVKQKNDVIEIYILDWTPSVAWVNKALKTVDKITVFDYNASTVTLLPDHLPSNVTIHPTCVSKMVCEHWGLPEPWWVKHIINHLWGPFDLNSRATYRALIGRKYKEFSELSVTDQERLYREGLDLLGADQLVINLYVALCRHVTVTLAGGVETNVVYLPPEFGKHKPSEWELIPGLLERLVGAGDCHLAMIVEASDVVHCAAASPAHRNMIKEFAKDLLCRQNRTFGPKVINFHLAEAHARGVRKAIKLQLSSVGQ